MALSNVFSVKMQPCFDTSGNPGGNVPQSGSQAKTTNFRILTRNHQHIIIFLFPVLLLTATCCPSRFVSSSTEAKNPWLAMVGAWSLANTVGANGYYLIWYLQPIFPLLLKSFVSGCFLPMSPLMWSLNTTHKIEICLLGILRPSLFPPPHLPLKDWERML